jgi:ribonuclease PH
MTPGACPDCAVLRTGTVSQATGSAYIEVGATKAMAGVYGPRPTDRREAFSEEGYFSVDVKLASFATRTRGRITQVHDRHSPRAPGWQTSWTAERNPQPHT